MANEERIAVDVRKIVVDATGAILGRLCSFAAKQALLGKEVIIVNCQNALVSGQKSNVIAEYHVARVRGGTSLRGPHFPKSPERLVKRTVRGMLSFQQTRGITAHKRVICYNDVPAEYHAQKKIKIESNKKTKTMTLLELSQRL